MQSRDELRHASRWWMQGARLAPGTQLAATARWKALKAMPEIASGSSYAYERSVQAQPDVISRQLYDRLRSECATSLEARNYAVYWSFPTRKQVPNEPKKFDFDEHYDRERDSIGQMGYRWFDDGAFGVITNFTEEDFDPYETPDKWKSIHDRVIALNNHGDWDTPPMAAEVAAIRKEVKNAYNHLGDARYPTLLDDLALFLQEPNLTPEVRRAYVNLRLCYLNFLTVPDTDQYDANGNDLAAGMQQEKVKHLLDDPVLKPVQEYVDFMKAAQGNFAVAPQKTANPSTNASAPRVDKYRRMEASLRAFLAKYPNGRKREAAMLLLARTVHWLTIPEYFTSSPKDDLTDPVQTEAEVMGELLNAYPAIKTTWTEPFDARRALEPLDAYDREFPNGRYAADIRNYRGTAEWHAHDWGAALDDTMANLDDAGHPDLQPEASLRLANIFGDLADERYRVDLLAAIRQRPKAIERLKQYLSKTWLYEDHPLRYLGTYLADQLAFHIEEPPPAPANN